jgi:serine/threonine protein kinase
MSKLEIIEKIGHGGMGEIFKARISNDHGFARIVAAKKILGEGRDRLPQETLREAEVLSKLNHPNICSVMDIREAEGSLYILMEYVDGTSLSEILQLTIQKGFHFSEDFLWSLGTQILRGLEHAHNHNNAKNPIIHRDLSPHNLMLNQQGQVKIIDFGVSKILNQERTLTQESTYGKLRYCAPEIFMGGQHSAKTDLYSLGLILFELALAVKIYDSINEAQIVAQKQRSDLDFLQLAKKGYSSAFLGFIQNLCAKIPEQRFESATRALAESTVYLKSNSAEELVKASIEELRQSEIDHTKTVLLSLKQPVSEIQSFKSKSKWIVLGTVILGIIGVAIALNLKQGFKKIEIRVLSAGHEVTLKSSQSEGTLTKVGGETGFYLDPYACALAGPTILTYPTTVFFDDIESLLKALNTVHTPKTFLFSIEQFFKNQDHSLELIKKNCKQSESFTLAAALYEDLEKNISILDGEDFKNFADIKKRLSSRVLFSDAKMKALQEAKNDFLTRQKQDFLARQLASIKIFDTKAVAGFSILSLPQEIFPANLADCRRFMDSIWIKNLYQADTRSVAQANFAILLMPFPLGAEISGYGQGFIEFSDLNKPESSLFKTKGLCVYKRVKGEVTESTFRHL